MAVVARGSLAERSAPDLVAALAARSFTGELAIEAGARVYRQGWRDGAIVGAQSPHPSDSAAKIALTLGVLSSTQAGEVVRLVAANPGVNELEVVAQAGRLSSDLVERLARRVAGARAARVMSVEVGTFVVDDVQPFWATVAPVDPRWIVYQGIRQHVTIDRCERELAAKASAVRLRDRPDLDGFGFGDAEAPVLALLREAELPIARLRQGGDRQIAQAVVFALLTTGEAVVARPPVAAAPDAGDLTTSTTVPIPVIKAPPPARPAATRPATGSPAAATGPATGSPAAGARPAAAATRPAPGSPAAATRPAPGSPAAGARPAAAVTRPPTGSPTATPSPIVEWPETATHPSAAWPDASTRPMAVPADMAAAASRAPAPSRAGTPSGAPPAAKTAPPPSAQPARSTPARGVAAQAIPGSRAPAGAAASAGARSRGSAAAPDKIRALILERLHLLDRGADYFQLLGITPAAGPDEIRSSYFALARHLHPDRLKAAGVTDDQKLAQKLFARMNEAFAVLTDPDKRARYEYVQRSGGEAAVRAREAEAEAAVRRALDAEERFRLGEMALRRQQFEVAVNEFKKAIELDPDEPDHQAMLGWALYVAATNKASAVPEARGHLLRAMQLNKKCVLAVLALGRIARMEGHDTEAQKHFQHAVELDAGNQEAATELRAIESRTKSAGKEGGFFSRLTRKP